MTSQSHEPHRSQDSVARVAAPIEPYAAAHALKHCPRGAFVVAGIAVALLFAGWLAFYLLLFLPRGSIG
jgi:hypothetical protein